MGYDISGHAPTTECGRYFHSSIFDWHGLAQLCEDLVPDVAAACLDWHSMDGHGLDAANAARLAERLRQLLVDGAATRYIRQHNEAIEQLPDEACGACGGAGKRATGTPNVTAICRRCSGSGRQPPFEAHGRLTLRDVERWISFLHACGGFSIC